MQPVKMWALILTILLAWGSYKVFTGPVTELKYRQQHLEVYRP